MPGPTKYIQGIHLTLCYYMSFAGLTLAQMAEKLGVTDRTLDTWCAKHPELKAAIKPGKDFIDNLVEGSLLKRALGYEVTEVTRENVEIGQDPGTGKKQFSMRVTKKVTKEIVPDSTAQIFWLKNRKGWRDHAELSIAHSGSVDVYSMTPEQRQQRIVDLLSKRAIPALAGEN